MTKVILLAEDSDDDEFFFLHVLKAARVENPVQVVHDGEQLMAYLQGVGNFSDRERHPLPGMLFLDLKMPRLDGLAVLKWLRAHPELQFMPVVVLTALEEPQGLRELQAIGAHTFLPKPFNGSQLRDLIGRYHNFWVRSV